MTVNDKVPDLTTLAVSLGRIEEKVSNLPGFDDRLRKLETTVERIEAKQQPRTPWYVIVGGMASGLVVVSGGVGLIVWIVQAGAL